MYCNNCGKHNPENSKFCKSCGSKIINMSEENEIVDTRSKDNSSTKNNNITQAKQKVDAGLGGWLALVGLGLIVGPFYTVSNIYGYFPLFNKTYNVPGYLPLLQFEFVIMIAFFLANIYLLYLYFKKNIKFPKYYVTYLIATAVFAIVDYILLNSLVAPTPEQQKILTDTSAQYTGTVSQAIITAIIWVWYMKKSKRVKATFIKTQ